MRIERVEINGFAKIRNLVIAPGSGLNVIYGANEAGKSTVQRFIRAMLYGVRNGREPSGLPAAQKRFMPWDGAPYGGSIIYSLDNGSTIRAERNFDKNTVRIFDGSYNDISGTFRLGKDKLPMFADEHLGMDEATFTRTAFIGQMDVRIGSSGSSELAARLANAKDTGSEGLSFQRAEAALANALKNRIGTERTRTQPLDRLEARLRQLEEEHARLTYRQKQRQSLKDELSDVKARLAGLDAQEQYLAIVEELIDTRKKIDAGIKKETNLTETAALLKDMDRKLSGLLEQERAAAENTGRNGGTSRESGYSADRPQNSRRFEKVKTFRFGPAVPLLCFAAALISGALLVSALTSGSRPDVPASMLLYGLVMLISAIVGTISLVKGMKAMYSRTGNVSGGLTGAYHGSIGDDGSTVDLANTGDTILRPDALKERAEGLALLKRNALNNASLICGSTMSRTEDVERALSHTRTELEELSARLQRRIEDAGKIKQPADSYFTGKDLDMVIYDTDISSLESVLRAEMESVRQSVLSMSLREKYCEGMADDDKESAYELQRVVEETVAVKEKIAYLRNKANAIKLAHEVLLEAGMEIRRDFAPGLNSRMSSIIAGITGQRYTDLRGDEALLLNAAAPEYGEVKNVLLLSGGTADQMYLAMRLAMTGLLTKGSESLPLIMDEVFSQFDDNRTALALKYLHNEYRGSQIFIFTCKQREVELARQIYGDRMNFVELGHEDF